MSEQIEIEHRNGFGAASWNSSLGEFTLVVLRMTEFNSKQLRQIADVLDKLTENELTKKDISEEADDE